MIKTKKLSKSYKNENGKDAVIYKNMDFHIGK
jgi:hypothetical protein